MAIGDNIREIRLQKGLTQKELGGLCGMADSAIRRYESGRGNPTEKTLKKIADALGVYVIELVSGCTVTNISSERMVADTFNLIADTKRLLNSEGYDLVFDEGLNHRVVPKGCEGQQTNLSEHIIQAFLKLNEEGKKVALERVLELTEIPRYQYKETKKEIPPANSDEPTDGE